MILTTMMPKLGFLLDFSRIEAATQASCNVATRSMCNSILLHEFLLLTDFTVTKHFWGALTDLSTKFGGLICVFKEK